MNVFNRQELYGYSSRSVVQGETATGKKILVKTVDDPVVAHAETDALQFWKDTPLFPDLIEVVDEQQHVRAWVDGDLAEELPDGGAEIAEPLGAALSVIHREMQPVNGVDPRRWPTAADWIAQQYWLVDHPLLTLQEQEWARRTLDVPWASLPQYTLHGDCYARNVLWQAPGLILIDPRGTVGPAAYDIACYASLSPGLHGPVATLHAIEKGYGSIPQYSAEMLLLFNLRAHVRYRGNHGLAQLGFDWREYSRQTADYLQWL